MSNTAIDRVVSRALDQLHLARISDSYMRLTMSQRQAIAESQRKLREAFPEAR